MFMEADLPDDVEALRALVLEQAGELDALKVFKAEIERLEAIIDALQRHRLGRRSEQLDPDQFELALEEVETALAEAEHAKDKASRAQVERPRKTNRGSLPAHLCGTSRSWTSTTRLAPAVVAHSTRSARTWLSVSMSCPPPSAFS